MLEALRGQGANSRGEVNWLGLANQVTTELPLQLPRLVPGILDKQEPNLLGNLRRNPVLGGIGQVKPAPKPGTPETVIAVESLDLKLTYIPAVELQMGSINGQFVEKLVHQVKISKPFYLGVYEVTQGQWMQLMNTEPWSDDTTYVRTGRDYPATYVSHDEAVEFCRRLTDQERQSKRLAENEVYRLPTEAEWEYACRARTTTKYSFGDDDGRIGEYAWCDGLVGNGSAKNEPYAHRVGLKLPNAWGLYDMHGNVSEWCLDWYDAWYYGRSPSIDPMNTKSSEGRVRRGGSWDFGSTFCASAFRGWLAPGNRHFNLGFRLIRGPLLSQ